MQPYNAEELIRKYLAGHCTAEEKNLVESWHLTELSQSTYTPAEEQINAVHQRMQVALTQHIRSSLQRPVTQKIWFRMAAAAVLAGLLFTGAYWLYTQSRGAGAPAALAAHSTILPGHDGAVLTLADGQKMVLDSLGNGLLTIQQGTKVLLNNGQLTYQAGSANAMTGAYNTINTPKGRQFKITLPDGSRVWLNAASSIRYPVAFTGDERKVYIAGEAYFEVAPSTPAAGGKKIPFIVDILPSPGDGTGSRVEVLGTHFNINAYEDEDAVRTTLLEGKVRIVRQEQSVILSPAQQAAIHSSNATSPILVQAADIEQVIAWKNGVFNFQNATLEKMMRQLARWYDIEVVYEKVIPDIVFEGEINRQNELADVLRILERMGVHFKLEGRRLTVLP